MILLPEMLFPFLRVSNGSIFKGFFHCIISRNLQDGAIPSGNGAAALVLARLGLLTGRENLRQQAEKLLQNNAGLFERHPTAFSVSLMAMRYLDQNAATLVITGNEENRQEFLEIARNDYRPGLEILCLHDNDDELSQLAPIVRGKETDQAVATAWLCQGQSCRPPVTSPEELARLFAS